VKYDPMEITGLRKPKTDNKIMPHTFMINEHENICVGVVEEIDVPG